jgi:hypothetical protein
MTEFKVTVLPEATKKIMMGEQYKLESMGCDEWLVHEECNGIDDKLERLDDYNRRVSKCGNGYKNRRR